MLKMCFFFLTISTICNAQTREAWVDLPTDQWPSIALTNHVLYKNGDRYADPSVLYAGTGFLIDNGGDTLAATAKHVLWIATNKHKKTVQVNSELSQWVMKPKGNRTDSAEIGQLLNEDSTEILAGTSSTILERDWLVFSVRRVTGAIYPLKPRYTAILPGEKVFMPGCAYNDSICRVYEGRVLRKEGMDILIERDINEQKGGSSGSPILDANGYLIGVLSSVTTDGKTGKGVTVAISTEYLSRLLQRKPGLNTPKKDYGELILKTTLEKGPKEAIRQYKLLAADPANYHTYNLRSASRNGLRETGEKLIEKKRIKAAIDILEFTSKVDGGFYVTYNVLAKAYLLSGNKKAAIRNYEISIKKNNDQDNAAFEELKKLKTP